MMKYSFIVLETKLINNVIHVYGAFVPVSDSNGAGTMALFQWYKLSEVKHES